MSEQRQAYRLIANQLAEKLGIDLWYVDYNQTTKQHSFRRTLYIAHQVVRDGKVIQAGGTTHTEWIPYADKVYATTTCYECQLHNGDLEWMLENGLTQEPHEMWAD